MSVRLTIDGPIAHLRIDRLEKRNAFKRTMWDAVPGLLDDVTANTDVRLLIIRSAKASTAFCAGADIDELLANKDDPDWLAANQAAINRVQFQLARFELPTLALIEGDCIGAGCGIAMACDLRVATTPKARFGITPAKLGLVYPIHDIKLLIDLVGPAQAKRLLYTGMLIGAQEAAEIGLIQQICEDPETLVKRLTSASPYAVRELKQFVRRVLDGQIEDDADTLSIFVDAFSKSDFAEGTRAFLAKRKPNFKR